MKRIAFTGLGDIRQLECMTNVMIEINTLTNNDLADVNVGETIRIKKSIDDQREWPGVPNECEATIIAIQAINTNTLKLTLQSSRKTK